MSHRIGYLGLGMLAAGLLTSSAMAQDTTTAAPAPDTTAPAPASVPAAPDVKTGTPDSAPGAPKPAALDKALGKELARGRFLDVAQARRRAAKPYHAPDSYLRPYAGASVGPAYAYELNQGVAFASAPAAQALCQSIVNQLLQAWDGPKPDIEVAITAEPTMHGEARPSGLILVSLGTFRSEQSYGVVSTEELALLLAHEVAHILLGHFDHAAVLDGTAHALSIAANGYMAYGAMDRTRMVGRNIQFAGEAGLVRRGLVANLASQTLIRDLLRPSFGRGKELEADRLGIDLAERAGYVLKDSTVEEFIRHHNEDQGVLTARMAALAMVMQAINEQLSVRAQRSVGGTGFLSDIVHRTTEQLGNLAITQTLAFVATRNKDHPDLDERINFDSQYLETNYPRDPNAVRPRRDPRSDDVKQDGAVMALLDHIRRASEVQKGIVDLAGEKDDAKVDSAFDQMLKQAGLQSAAAAAAKAQNAGKPAATRVASRGRGNVLKASKVAIATAPASTPGFGDDNAPLTWSMEGVLDEAGGNVTGAQGSWSRGLQTSYPAVDMAARWARTLTPEQRTAQLGPVVTRFKSLFGSADPVMDVEVADAVGRGDIVAAETTAANCLTYDNGRLYPSCVEFLGYDPTNKDTPAKTPEGKQAFLSRSLEKNSPLKILTGVL